MPLDVPWSVTINGQVATERMNPYVERIEIDRKAGGSADTARLVFDDTDGQIVFPPEQAAVEITVLGRLRFRGFIDGSPESLGSRGGGRLLNLNCKGFDKSGKVKQAQSWSKDDATLKDFFDEAAKKAGLKGIKIDPEFAKIKRPYWSTKGRNFLALGQALADELGGTFKISGDQAVLAKRGEGKAPGGAEMPTVFARDGDNLISWRINPKDTKPRFKKVKVRRYDRAKAKWTEEEVEIGQDGGDAEDVPVAAKPDKESAKQAAAGRKAASQREGGSGEVTIDINVEAEVEGTCVVEGARDGIDGPYRIDATKDVLTRKGSTSTLTLKQPQGDAGKDKRAKKASAGK